MTEPGTDRRTAMAPQIRQNRSRPCPHGAAEAPPATTPTRSPQGAPDPPAAGRTRADRSSDGRRSRRRRSPATSRAGRGEGPPLPPACPPAQVRQPGLRPTPPRTGPGRHAEPHAAQPWRRRGPAPAAQRRHTIRETPPPLSWPAARPCRRPAPAAARLGRGGNLSLLSLVVLLSASSLAAAAAAWSESGVTCGGRSYRANSTYEANLRHLAAVLPAETIASRWHRVVDRAVGHWPNRVQASASCWTWTDNDGDCAACIAEAFKEVERVCPFRSEATFSSDDCFLRLAEFSIFRDVFRRNTMFEPLAMGMMLQAFGLACIFFKFIQVWRHDSKKRAMTRHTPLLSGDQ